MPVRDTLEPDRIVIGLPSDGSGRDTMAAVYAPIVERTGCPVVFTDVDTAEIVPFTSTMPR